MQLKQQQMMQAGHYFGIYSMNFTKKVPKNIFLIEGYPNIKFVLSSISYFNQN